MTPEPGGTAPNPHDGMVLEAGKRLSQSIIWRLQRAYFDGKGIAAWSEGEVPMYVTSNPFVAQSYASLVSAHVADTFTTLDPAAPLYIFELGSGTGQFAFHFLRQLPDSLSALGLPPLRWVYVMTEYNPQLISFWHSHPALQPFVAAGQLDFAHFDASAPDKLVLQHGQTALAKGDLQNPAVVIANYFFDSIPQDAFYVEDGRIFESLVTVRSDLPQPNADDPAILDHVRLSYERVSTPGICYGDPALDGLLEEYAQTLDQSAVWFPAAALRCLSFFSGISDERLVLLTCDKGYHRPEDVRGRKEPTFEVHGSFSMGVNYHAIQRFFERAGGMSWFSPHRHHYLEVCAFLLGASDHSLQRTRLAFDRQSAFGPEEYFLVQSSLDREGADLPVEQVLAWLRLGKGDARVFRSCFSSLLATIEKASPVARECLRQAVNEIWQSYYHIGEAHDLPYDLGIVMYKLGEYQDALRLFTESLGLYGSEPKTLFNMALCHYCRGSHQDALDHVERALAVEPAFEPALNLQKVLLKQGWTNTSAV